MRKPIRIRSFINGFAICVAIAPTAVAAADEVPEVRSEVQEIPKRRSTRQERMLRPRFTWDANLDGGLGPVFTSPVSLEGFGRVRLGALWVRDPFLFSVGATYDASTLSAANVGLQTELAHLERGYWVQLGAFKDALSTYSGVSLSAGYALLGVEGQIRGADETGVAAALYGKLRIPLRILVLALE